MMGDGGLRCRHVVGLPEEPNSDKTTSLADQGVQLSAIQEVTLRHHRHDRA